MHIVILTHYYDPGFPTPQALIDRYQTTTGFAEALVASGTRVSVLHRYEKNSRLQQNGVEYYFVADRYPYLLNRWQMPGPIHKLARDLNPDVVHLHSLYFALQAFALRRMLAKHCSIVIQDHAGLPPRRWYRHILRQALKSCDGFLFAADELGQAWVDAGIITSSDFLYTVMEGSTRFTMTDRAEARRETGLGGEPVFLWVGRLNDNKDPLTTLKGFEAALADMPGGKLYMVYHEADLLAEVTKMIRDSARLRTAVTLLGEQDHQKLPAFYNSADYFILGSHKEGSGYALAEGLACGLVPIVTDIPSFRMMTNGGRFGGLWPVGDAQALTRTILEVTGRPLAGESAKALRFFDDSLSFPGIARVATDIYARVLRRRRSG